MFHHVPLQVQNEKFGSTRWHSLHDKYKPLFSKGYVEIVENWYNRIASSRHRDAFRDVLKGIHHSAPAEALQMTTAQSAHAIPLEVHRASHMAQLYGSGLSQEGRLRARTWLLTAAAPDIDKFRDIFTAIGQTVNAQSTTKESYVDRPVAVPTAKDRNRRKIDWSSEKAQELMKKVENPMAGQRLPLIAAPPLNTEPSAGSRSKKVSVSSLPPELEQKLEATFEELRDRQRANNLEGVYTVQDGHTVYHAVKSRARNDGTRERIVATFDNPSAVGWKSTTREHIKNHGLVKREVISADQHPAIARVTASLGLCVPTLKPKTFGPSLGSSPASR